MNPVLIVEDDQTLRQFLSISLSGAGFQTHQAATGAEALKAAREHHFSVLLLDLGLPDLDGREVLKGIRGWSEVPILVLSVQDREATIVEALDLGADDYLTKPFRLNELFARIRAAQRRVEGRDSNSAQSVGQLRLDSGSRTVQLGGQSLALTPNEYRILELLIFNTGRVVSHQSLLTKVWGPEFLGDRQLLRVHISNLRKKLERADGTAPVIRSEPGIGYRLQLSGEDLGPDAVKPS